MITFNRICLALVIMVALCYPAKGFCEQPRWYVEGFEPMCARIPVECEPYRNEPAVIALTPNTFEVMNRVNTKVNEEIEYQTDIEHYHVSEYFNYPTDGKGDCEDFALEKRRRLAALDWPRRAMLLVVVDRPGKNDIELHMLLILRTDHGDLALDINHPQIKPVDETEYSIDWIQSQKNPKIFDDGPGLRTLKR